eukprot:scaffold11629_cov131-Isochrysis_galbana.AAC.12
MVLARVSADADDVVGLGRNGARRGLAPHVLQKGGEAGKAGRPIGLLQEVGRRRAVRAAAEAYLCVFVHRQPVVVWVTHGDDERRLGVRLRVLGAAGDGGRRRVPHVCPQPCRVPVLCQALDGAAARWDGSPATRAAWGSRGASPPCHRTSAQRRTLRPLKPRRRRPTRGGEADAGWTRRRQRAKLCTRTPHPRPGLS